MVSPESLAKVFRGKYLDGLRRAFDRGELRFAGSVARLAEPSAFGQFLATLRAPDWVVYAKRPFGGPAQVLEYLVMGDGHENMKFFSSFTGVYRSHHAPCYPRRNPRDAAPRSSALALQRRSAFSGSCGPGRASSAAHGRR